jgi:SAM-dependent methyltransferase
MNQLIEHVEDPLAATRKAFEVLRPGGVLIIETPNINSWDARLFQKRYWGGWHAPRHWNLFDSETLSQCVKRAGFDIIEVSYILSPFSWLHSVQYCLREYFGLQRFARWFDVDHFIPLCIVSTLDLIQLGLTGRTANMRLIAKKPS